MDADRQLRTAREDEAAARQAAELAQLRAATTEQLLATRETAAAQQARADQAITLLDATRAEARDAIHRAAQSDATRQAAEHARDDALASLAVHLQRADVDAPAERPAAEQDS